MSSIVSTKLIDAYWRVSHGLAVEAMTYAHAPYSCSRVSAAALADDGRLVSGRNMENVDYGVTLCAGCDLVSELARTGGGRLITLACMDVHGRILVPCGHCRRLLSEHVADGMALVMSPGMMDVDEALPGRLCANGVERVVGPQS